MREAHLAGHNTSPGVGLPTPSRSVYLLCASSIFLCIDISEICVHPLNPQLEPYDHRKYTAPFHAVVHLIYTSCYNS
jgi:hypothetical protein